MIEALENNNDIVCCVKCRRGFKKVKSFYSHYLWENPEIREKMLEGWNSPERKKKASIKTKELWENSEYKNKKSESMKERWNDLEYRKKISKVLEENRKNPKRIEGLRKSLQTLEYKNKRSGISKEQWKDSEYRKKILKNLDQGRRNPKRIEKLKEAHKNPEYKKKVSENFKKLWENPEFREKMVGLSNSKERIEKNRKIGIERFENPEYKEKMRQVAIKTFTSEKFKKEQSVRSKKLWTDEFRKKRSEQVKEQWKDEKFRKINVDRINSLWGNPEKAAEMLRNSRIVTGCKLNNCERQVETILNEMYPGVWEFVGDGTKVIYRYCPDFINEKDKLILEFFGGYWHNRTGEKERDAKRIEAFSRYGYETIVIWENELKDIEAVKNKIRNFCENRNKIEAIAV